MTLLFTTPNGEIFALTPEEFNFCSVYSTTNSPMQGKACNKLELPMLLTNPDPISCDGSADAASTPHPQNSTSKSYCSLSCRSCPPLIEILTKKEILLRNSPDPPQTPGSPNKLGRRDGNKPRVFVKVAMEYDEYGQLLEESKLRCHPTTDELSLTQKLRVIKKKFHHELRGKISKVLATLTDDELLPRRLTMFFDPMPVLTIATPEGTPEAIPEDNHAIPVYRGRSRVLEIGCSDGTWCFRFKEEQPTWIVEGVDDSNHWLCADKDLIARDFMASEGSVNSDDYFSRMHSTQAGPEFTVRSINALLTHEKPIFQNAYEVIRAREIFDRVESYKTFLEEIRLILKPDGIVEFIEIDPRPRFPVGCKREEIEKAVKKKSGTQTDMEDRFKNPFDIELATDVPGWSKRVEERQKAILRPLREGEGVAAANLKSWLQGAGFYDVREIVLPIPVGGNKLSGQYLKEYLLYQIELEDAGTELHEKLPAVEMNALESGSYYLNLHIVAGNKPAFPRPGDLLKDGTRQDMTAAKYNTMAHINSKIAWKRFDLESKLSNMLKNLPAIPGAPEARTATRGSVDLGLYPLLAGKSNGNGSPFNAPLFVAVEKLEDHRQSPGIGEGDKFQPFRSG